MLSWEIAKNVTHPFDCIHFINALKQRGVQDLIEMVKVGYPQVRALCVFGSAVSPRCRPDSDIDVLVVEDAPSGIRSPDNGEVYDLLPTTLHRGRLSNLLPEIEREGVVVYDRDAL